MSFHQIGLVFVAVGIAALAGCNRDATSGPGGPATATIEPAKPQPAPTGTDAMTQTVDVEDSRSDAEGGALTSSPATETSTIGTTGTAPASPPPTTTTQ